MAISESETQTKQIAADLLSRILPKLKTGPVIISLQGDYGAGKTQFVKGLAEVLGITANVVSPSYVYVRNYPFAVGQNKGELVHIDAWRVKSESDFKLLGVEEYLKPGYVIAIEWPQQFAETLLKTLEQSRAQYELIDVSLSELDADRREIQLT